MLSTFDSTYQTVITLDTNRTLILNAIDDFVSQGTNVHLHDAIQEAINVTTSDFSTFRNGHLIILSSAHDTSNPIDWNYSLGNSVYSTRIHAVTFSQGPQSSFLHNITLQSNGVYVADVLGTYARDLSFLLPVL